MIENRMPAAQNAQKPEEENEISLLDIAAQLFARKWWIIAALMLGAFAGAFVGQLPANQFEASSVVQIEQRSSSVQLPAELIGELLRGEASSSPLATEVHIIRSRLILQQVIEALSLDLRVIPVKAPVIGELLARRNLPVLQDFLPDRYARSGEFLRLARFEPSDPFNYRDLVVTVLDGERVSLTLPDGEVVEGAVGAPIALPEGGVVEISAMRAAPGREFLVYRDRLRNVVGHIASGLNIRERGNTGIVDFRFTGGDPSESVRIINSVVATYQNHNLRRRAAQIDQSITFIEDQMPVLRNELRAASAALSEYRQSQDGRELSQTTQQLLSQSTEIETELENIGFRREQLLLRLTPNHPDYLALVAEEMRLRSRLENLRDMLADVPEAEQELARLTQQVDRARQLELQLVNRVEQLRILRASTVGNIFVLEPSETARHAGPDRRTPIMIGAALGFVLSALGIFGINLMRRGIEDARQIEELGLPLYATITKSREIIGVKSSDPRYGMALNNPGDIVVEALRGLRTGLRFSLAAANSKSLMITSCAPADGKSFIALNLAIVSGQAGSRVLLIDGDMRRGFLRRFFGLDRNTPGLSDLLSGTATLSDAIHSHESASIDFISTGSYPPNPAELLASTAFAALLKSLNQHYDLVIIDAPPALAVSDPAIIGQHVGMTLLVVRHLSTPKSELQSVQKTLANSGVPVSGVVLNQFDQKRSRYGAYGAKYGYYYGGYRYKYD